MPSGDLGRKSGALDRWKQLQREGWNVTALIAPDKKTVIALGLKLTRA